MKPIVIALFVLLLLAPLVQGAEHVRWVKSLEEALRQAKERGTMVFVAEIVNHEPANLAQVDVFKDPAFIRASRDFVCLFACPHADTPTINMKIDGETVETSAWAPGMTRADHLKAWDDVRKSYADLNTNSMGDMKLPFHFVLNADGKHLTSIVNGTVEGGFDTAPVNSFIQVFAELVSKYGRGLSQKEYDECTEQLDKAVALREKGDLRAALRIAKAVLDRNSTSKLADRAREIQESALGVARSRLQEAEDLSEKDPVAAVVALESVSEDFAGTSVASEAKTIIAKLKRDPRVKSAMKELAARKEAEKGFRKAEGEIGAKRYSKALAILDGLAKKFKGSALGEKAQKRAEELRADPEISRAVTEQEAAKHCKRWLSMGRTYAANGMADKARKQFQQVIDKYPGTSYAEQAAAELKKLR